MNNYTVYSHMFQVNKWFLVPVKEELYYRHSSIYLRDYSRLNTETTLWLKTFKGKGSFALIKDKDNREEITHIAFSQGEDATFFTLKFG